MYMEDGVNIGMYVRVRKKRECMHTLQTWHMYKGWSTCHGIMTQAVIFAALWLGRDAHD